RGQARPPEAGECPEARLGHHGERLYQRGLAFQHGLRGAPAVIRVLQLEQRIEVDVLALQGVHQLVRDTGPHDERIDVRRHIEGVRVGIEVAADLLGEDVRKGFTQVKRIRHEAEEAQRRLQPGELRGREILVELVDDVVPHLIPVARRDRGIPFEFEPGYLLERGHPLVHQLAQRALALHRLRPIAAPQDDAGGEHCAGAAQPLHPCHSMLFATDAPTARAMSWPRTTIPWCSSSSRSSWSSSSGRARSGTKRSVSTIAALRASSVIATAWCRSRRGRRATSTSHVWIASSSSTTTGWKRRSSAGSPRIHLSYSPPVVAPIMRMSP